MFNFLSSILWLLMFYSTTIAWFVIVRPLDWMGGVLGNAINTIIDWSGLDIIRAVTIVSVQGCPWTYTEESGTIGPASYQDFNKYATEEQKELWKNWSF